MKTYNQFGRSMIEMLGVLAVIGLLSVGGIAGYSKAMMRYKVSKTIDQITEVNAKISAYGDQLASYEGLGNQAALRANLAPAAAPHKGEKITNPFGGEIVIKAAKLLNNGDNMAYSVEYDEIPEEACLSLAAHDWARGPNASFIGIVINNSDTLLQGCSGYNKARGSVCVDEIPLSPARAVELCTSLKDNRLLVKYF